MDGAVERISRGRLPPSQLSRRSDAIKSFQRQDRVGELIGAAIALKLLFGIPLVVGVPLTGLEVLLVLGLQRRGYCPIEAIVLSLMAVIGLCFAAELFLQL